MTGRGVKLMSNLADKLRKSTEEALENSYKHNEEIDILLLEFIYSECQIQAVKGFYNFNIRFPELIEGVKDKYRKEALTKCKADHVSKVKENSYYQDINDIKDKLELPEYVVDIVEQVTETKWYRNVNVNNHLIELLESEGFEVEIPIDVRGSELILYWSNNMGGNE